MTTKRISFIARMGVAFSHSTLWRYTLNFLIVILVILLASLILMHTAKAAAGDLDLTFGSNGKVTTDFGGTTDYLNAVVLQPDGKIVVAGNAIMDFPPPGSHSDFALACYNTDGSLDATFGSNGEVVTHFNGGYNVSVAAYDLARQPDGKLVIVGVYIQDYGVTPVFALARYNSNGSLDATFGSNGELITNVQGYAEAMALQPDGKIIAGGHIRVGYHDNDFELARFNSDGSPDTSFGNNGKVTTTFNSNSDDLARAITLQPDGKIIAAGATGTYPHFDFPLVRYTRDGQIDPSFGNNGKISTDFF